MRFGAVILTTGQRPKELRAALASIASQCDVEVSTVVVLNSDDAAAGPPLGELGEGITVVTPGRNVGIPAGRNLGVRHLTGRTVTGAPRLDAAVRGNARDDAAEQGDTHGPAPHEIAPADVSGEAAPVDAVLFLDDDAELLDAELLAAVGKAFQADERLAVVSLRIVDPATGATQRRHVPRLRAADSARSSWVTTFLGGASVIRTQAFVEAGGLPELFFYAHEETSLAWRLIDRGWRLRYRGDLQVAHPATSPQRHTDFHRLSTRNRVLLAHLHLPFVIAVIYTWVWLALSFARSPKAALAILRGVGDGLKLRHLARQPIRWRTVATMARYGRPPII